MRIAEARGGIRAQAVAAALTAALALAGCVTNQQPPSLTDAEGASIIFESIDGPPRPVSTRLARSLDQEAAARRLVVVARGGQALYHIRGYVAANRDAGATSFTTSFTWAFDVYDAERRRAFRLNGEERATGSRSGGWSAADDQALQRIASNSVAQIMAFIASDRAAPTAEAAPPNAQGSLSTGQGDDFGPEAAGIFRMLVSGSAAAPDSAGPLDR